jgi:hypothetical protein
MLFFCQSIDHVHCDTRVIPIEGAEQSAASDNNCVGNEIAIFIAAVDAFGPRTATLTFISHAPGSLKAYVSPKIFDSAEDMLNLKDIACQLLQREYQVRVYPVQTELYGSPQKCTRYIVYASSGGTNCSSYQHSLPCQQLEQINAHVKTAGEALRRLEDVDVDVLGSSNETNVNNEKIADHSALLPMKSLGSYFQLDKKKPWLWSVAAWPMKHYNQERLVTIREMARLCGIYTDSKPIAGNTQMEKMAHLLCALPSVVAACMAFAVRKTYDNKNQKGPVSLVSEETH